MSESPATERITASRGDAAVLTAVLIGSLVAVGLGAFGKIHEPQFFSVNVAGFSSGTAVKAWLGTFAVVLALFQLVSAFVMYRLIPGGRAPAWISIAHVWSGRLAVLASVPVAVHCLYALGFAETDGRVLFHSLFGCLFYGVFVTKMMLLTRKGLRGWVIPIAGGLLFFVLVYVWLTSALWFFQTSGITF
ncbi:DUF6529 family protein [Mycolicibacterium gadium]|jgi:hypothetical protein|uniref:DUF6529 family protein n=1 Tax=Mycolicibacterium gadium TaxID=1794 RepID=A0ABT6GKK5_MYCGU|nr:DUF6529 family protein [Mycolicibacterium gadium]MDG5481842.1 DUF6529 family protein [Mycolicibacterium gadium]